MHNVKVVLKRYRIRRASASACTLCPFPKYCPVFQKGILLRSYSNRFGSEGLRPQLICCAPFPGYSLVFQNTIGIVSEDLDGYHSVSEGLDDYHMISGCRDKYHYLSEDKD